MPANTAELQQFCDARGIRLDVAYAFAALDRRAIAPDDKPDGPPIVATLQDMAEAGAQRTALLEPELDLFPSRVHHITTEGPRAASRAEYLRALTEMPDRFDSLAYLRELGGARERGQRALGWLERAGYIENIGRRAPGSHNPRVFRKCITQ